MKWFRCAWCDAIALDACLYCGRALCDECRFPIVADRLCRSCYRKEVVERDDGPVTYIPEWNYIHHCML
jgi:hypothetical protein